MIDGLKYVFFAVYALMLVIYMMGTAAGAKALSELEAAGAKKNPLNALCGIGCFLLKAVGYRYDSTADVKLIERCRLLYGARHALVHYKLNMAQKVTVGYVTLMLTMLIYPLTGELVMIVLGLALTAGLVYNLENDLSGGVKKRSQAILRDFPTVLSKLALLINTGMTMRNAWITAASSGRGVLYDEMKKSVEDMYSGLSERDAYIAFADRCGVPEVRKFVSMLVQNLEKANAQLTEFLIEENAAGWELRKHLAKRAGERANSLLLIPILLIFIGIMVMILVPMLTNLGI